MNPRYAAWLKITGGGANYEYMAWINSMINTWKEGSELLTPEDHKKFDKWLDKRTQDFIKCQEDLQRQN